MVMVSGEVIFGEVVGMATFASFPEGSEVF